jgi:hypothetical protein
MYLLEIWEEEKGKEAIFHLSTHPTPCQNKVVQDLE